jgi:hypothetical protein
LTEPNHDTQRLSTPDDRRRPDNWWGLLWALPLAALVLFVIAFASTMGHEAPRLAGSNSVILKQPVVQISGGSELCQSTLAAKDAESIRLFVVPPGAEGPPLAVRLSGDGGRTLATGRVAGWSGGVVNVPIRRIRESAPDGELCIRNEGRDAVAFAGSPSEFLRAKIDGQSQNAAITVLLFRAGKESWTDLLPTIAHRAGVLKGALAGAWIFWAAVALIALAGVVSLAVVYKGRGE